MSLPPSHRAEPRPDGAPRLTPTHLHVGSRSWPLSAITRVAVEAQSPPWRVHLGLLAAGLVIGVAVLLSGPGRGELGSVLRGAGLLLAAALVFGSAARLLTLGDRFWLLLYLEEGPLRAHFTADRDRADRLAARVAEAALAARSRA